MKVMEKIKNEEKLSYALPVSIKCGWRENDVDNVQQDEDNAYIGVQTLLQEIEDHSMLIRKANVEYIIAQRDHKHRYQKCNFHWSTPCRIYLSSYS